MKARKPKLTAELGKGSLEQALAHFMKTDPKKVVQAVAGEILKQREDVKRRISEVRKELEDGARPKNGRVRL